MLLLGSVGKARGGRTVRGLILKHGADVYSRVEGWHPKVSTSLCFQITCPSLTRKLLKLARRRSRNGLGHEALPAGFLRP